MLILDLQNNLGSRCEEIIKIYRLNFNVSYLPHKWVLQLNVWVTLPMLPMLGSWLSSLHVPDQFCICYVALIISCLYQLCRPSQYPTHHLLHVYPFASIGHPLSFAQYLAMVRISMFVEHGCKNFACIPFAHVLTFYVLICFQPIPDCSVVLIVLHLDMPL